MEEGGEADNIFAGSLVLECMRKISKLGAIRHGTG